MTACGRWSVVRAAGLGWLCLLAIVLWPAGARGLEVSPALHELSARPGEAIERTLVVHNDEATAATLSFGVREVRLTADQQLELKPSSDDGSVTRWFEFSPTRLTLAAGEQRTAEFTIRVPADAAPASHITMVTVERSGDGLGEISISPVVGVTVLINVETDQSPSASYQIAGFQAQPRAAEDRGVTVTMSIANDGPFHVRPHGSVTIRNQLLGTVLDTIPVNSEFRYLIPGQERTIAFDWTSADWRRFGRLEAAVELDELVAGQRISVVRFWYLPWPVVLGLTVSIMALLSAMVTLARHPRRLRWR